MPTVKGKHKGFPAYTIYVLDKDGKIVKVIEVYTPESVFDVFELLEEANFDFSFDAERKEEPSRRHLSDD